LYEIEILKNLKPGQSLQLQWLNLWRSKYQYRDDASVWSNSYKNIIFKDDKKYSYEQKSVINDHTGRIPDCYAQNYVKCDQIKILHYQFVSFERMLSKQRWYMVVELLNNGNAHSINNKYKESKNEKNIILKKLEMKYIEEWERIKLLTDFEKKYDNWYDQEIKNIFSQKNVNFFTELNIWDTDLTKYGLLEDPRNKRQKKYHSYMNENCEIPLRYKLLSIISKFI
jgi:hypothetical protein